MVYSALIGNPVEHSISPYLFKMLGDQAGVEYYHIKIKVASPKYLPKVLNSLRDLDFVGANVTLPYKLAVMKYLDVIDKTAELIGAVNTIVFKKNKMIGYNTDANAALLSIENYLKPVLKGDRVLIFGAGGAARAIIYELKKIGAIITVLDINLLQARRLVNDLSLQNNLITADRLSLKNIKLAFDSADYVINATPLGMSPNIRSSIIPISFFKTAKNIQHKYFFDAVFNPPETLFLRLARLKGASTCSGVKMLIYQAIKAFNLWTGYDFDKVNIESLEKNLSTRLFDK